MTQETITHREQGKKWVLPMYLMFNDCGHFFGKDFSNRHRHRKYNVLGYRAPKAGEWFISGARATAYYMPNDSTQKHIVVQPSEEMYALRTVSMYVKM